jgi:glycosyltransferase involved in cell wall biosynthesis
MSASTASPAHLSPSSWPAQSDGQAMTVSALMSTHAGETAANLAESLESIYAQTVPLDQIVLVLDGRVDPDQEEIIARFGRDARIADQTLVRLEQNIGLARAMNAGLERCIGAYTMRADSDDLCHPQRLELQLAYAGGHPETDVVASWIAEFTSDGRPDQLKVSPVYHDAVTRALRWRNVLAHPSVFIRTETLRRVGGYRPEYGLLEDYDLFVRLVLSGAQFHVIPKILVRMRSGIEQRRRRGGLRYCMNEIRFRSYCFRAGFLNTREFVIVTLMYVTFRLIGGIFRQRLYAFARNPTGSEPSTPVVPPQIESKPVLEK